MDAVHGQLLQAGLGEVRVDFHEPELCNSSGFKAFIHWIRKVQAAPGAQRSRRRQP